jgi:antitoxin HicB
MSMTNIALGYPYKLKRQSNGWWLVRFPDFPEALTEGGTQREAIANARDCLITALEGYRKAGRSIPRQSRS